MELYIEFLKEIKKLKKQVDYLRRLEKGDYMDDVIKSGGWIEIPDGSWSYLSATSITVPSGAASIYAIGDQVRLKQGGAYKYFYVVGIADTVLTVTGGSDYTVASATITDVSFSKGGGVGHPGWFNFSPTYSASGSMTYTPVTTTYAKFSILSRKVSVLLRAIGTLGGTANAIIYYSLPVSAPAQRYGYGQGILDSTYLQGFTIFSGTTGNLYKTPIANYGLGSGKEIYISIDYDI